MTRRPWKTDLNLSGIVAGWQMVIFAVRSMDVARGARRNSKHKGGGLGQHAALECVGHA
jgi:hypothetical protein